MELSKRLQAVAGMVSAGNTAADVGCDHGYIAIALVQRNVCPRVIALDVNAGPLQRARQHIRAHGMEDYIETRLSDGMAALHPGEADTLICAGMGARLIQRILRQGMETALAMQEWVLQPQSEPALLRAYVRELGYAIADERMVCEEGKYYPVIKITPVINTPRTDRVQDMHRQAAIDKFGPVLLEKNDAILYAFLQERKTHYETLREVLLAKKPHEGQDEMPKRRQERLKEIEEELQHIRLAMERYAGYCHDTMQ